MTFLLTWIMLSETFTLSLLLRSDDGERVTGGLSWGKCCETDEEEFRVTDVAWVLSGPV